MDADRSRVFGVYVVCGTADRRPEYSSIWVVRSIGYAIFTSVTDPFSSYTGSSRGWTKPVYAASSDIVRGYASRIAPFECAPGPTSTELMLRFEGTAAGSSGLTRAMAIAERVKFGRLRTGSDALAAHLVEVRTWLSEARS